MRHSNSQSKFGLLYGRAFQNEEQNKLPLHSALRTLLKERRDEDLKTIACDLRLYVTNSRTFRTAKIYEGRLEGFENRATHVRSQSTTDLYTIPINKNVSAWLEFLRLADDDNVDDWRPGILPEFFEDFEDCCSCNRLDFSCSIKIDL